MEDQDGLPTLRPSVGNWQQACRSHYLITRGEVVWCDAWSPQEVAAGRAADAERRRIYDDHAPVQGGLWARLWARLKRGDNAGNGNNDVQWVKVLVDARSREVFAFQPQIVPANRVAVPAPWVPLGSSAGR